MNRPRVVAKGGALLLAKAKRAKPSHEQRSASVGESQPYVLEDQIGFVLRQATQRHAIIFSEMIIEDLTATQFSALVKLYQHKCLPQNKLGRLTAMDIATIKGVIDRLEARGYVAVGVDPKDARLRVLSLTERGSDVARKAIGRGHAISAATLAPLNPHERREFLSLLRRLI